MRKFVLAVLVAACAGSDPTPTPKPTVCDWSDKFCPGARQIITWPNPAPLSTEMWCFYWCPFTLGLVERQIYIVDGEVQSDESYACPGP